jgi:hypothetical protein
MFFSSLKDLDDPKLNEFCERFNAGMYKALRKEEEEKWEKKLIIWRKKYLNERKNATTTPTNF